MPVTFLHPRYWAVLVGFGCMYLLAFLPFLAKKKLAAAIGVFAYKVDKKHRRITDINLQICFPEKSAQERDVICRQCFQAMCLGFMVLSTAWLGPKKQILSRLKIHGKENVHNAFDNQQGVLLMGGHQAMLETALFLGEEFPFVAVYRQPPNPFMEWLIRKGRGRYCKNLVPRSSMKQLLVEAKRKQICAIIPDQDVGRSGTVFSSFFGMTAATSTAIPRIMDIANARVLPFASALGEDGCLHVWVLEAIEFSSDQDLKSKIDALNKVLEDQIRRFPEQYLWQHKRFKTQPNGVPSPYE